MDGRLALPLLAGPTSGLAIDGDDFLRGSGQRGYPGDEAALELLVVQHGEDIARKMVVRRRAIGEGTEAAQQVQLLAAEQGDVGDGLRAGKDGDQAEEQDLRQWVVHLALLAGIFQIIEMSQEDDDFVEPRPVRCRFRHSPPPACELRVVMDSALSRFVTYLLHPIALNVFASDLVVEGVEAVAGFSLRFRVQRRLQFLNTVRS